MRLPLQEELSGTVQSLGFSELLRSWTRASLKLMHPSIPRSQFFCSKAYKPVSHLSISLNHLSGHGIKVAAPLSCCWVSESFVCSRSELTIPVVLAPGCVAALFVLCTLEQLNTTPSSHGALPQAIRHGARAESPKLTEHASELLPRTMTSHEQPGARYDHLLLHSRFELTT